MGRNRLPSECAVSKSKVFVTLSKALHACFRVFDWAPTSVYLTRRSEAIVAIRGRSWSSLQLHLGDGGTWLRKGELVVRLQTLKGPYPLGDFGVIGTRIVQRRPILAPMLALTNGYGLLIGPLPTITADIFQACLIFHCRLVARRQPEPGDYTRYNQDFTIEFSVHH